MGCGLDEPSEWKLSRALRGLDNDPLHIVRTLRLPPWDAAYEGADPVLREIAPRIRRHGMARFASIEWQPAHAETKTFTRLMEHLRQLSFDPKLHAGIPESSGAIATALECGASSVDHLENMPPADAAALGTSETIATLAPASEWNEGRAAISARDWIDSGVAVALATNFSAGQPGTLSMQMVVALAVSRMGMTINEAICAATINGAHALRCADRTGSLEPGKAADLLILNASDYRELGRNIGANLVHSTMKDGRFIYREGKVVSEKSRPS
jgi:imidazolonepropionase